ncbi:methyltransferase domain-containing protein [Henriciella sp. AS95]|uniref:class I SAM-dependent methyltransferase n=1 Tax=Henriciella sp. AS95 TaxID=3135782 RepID=UPI00316FC20D
MDLPENPFLKAFADPEFVAEYQDGPPKFMPGFFDVHRMATVLLSERAPEHARILVLGAGGGLELQSLTSARPSWTFEGIDPAPEMLKLARDSLGTAAERVQFVEGYIEDATEGPFDGAVCLLTMHFLDHEGRERTAREIRRRLKPDAPFVVAHASFTQQPEQYAQWLDRYEAFAIESGVDPDMARQAREGVEHVPLLAPEEDEAILEAAGFKNVSMFYAGFTWRGWVAYA